MSKLTKALKEFHSIVTKYRTHEEKKERIESLRLKYKDDEDSGIPIPDTITLLEIEDMSYEVMGVFNQEAIKNGQREN